MAKTSRRIKKIEARIAKRWVERAVRLAHFIYYSYLTWRCFLAAYIPQFKFLLFLYILYQKYYDGVYKFIDKLFRYKFSRRKKRRKRRPFFIDAGTYEYLIREFFRRKKKSKIGKYIRAKIWIQWRRRLRPFLNLFYDPFHYFIRSKFMTAILSIPFVKINGILGSILLFFHGYLSFHIVELISMIEGYESKYLASFSAWGLHCAMLISPIGTMIILIFINIVTFLIIYSHLSRCWVSTLLDKEEDTININNSFHYLILAPTFLLCYYICEQCNFNSNMYSLLSFACFLIFLWKKKDIDDYTDKLNSKERHKLKHRPMLRYSITLYRFFMFFSFCLLYYNGYFYWFWNDEPIQHEWNNIIKNAINYFIGSYIEDGKSIFFTDFYILYWSILSQIDDRAFEINFRNVSEFGNLFYEQIYYDENLHNYNMYFFDVMKGLYYTIKTYPYNDLLADIYYYIGINNLFIIVHLFFKIIADIYYTLTISFVYNGVFSVINYFIFFNIALINLIIDILLSICYWGEFIFNTSIFEEDYYVVEYINGLQAKYELLSYQTKYLVLKNPIYINISFKHLTFIKYIIYLLSSWEWKLLG